MHLTTTRTPLLARLGTVLLVFVAAFAVALPARPVPAAPVEPGPDPAQGPIVGHAVHSETSNRGDPIALYDPLADRWLMSQFAFTGSGTSGPYFQCIAISQTPDPTGAWFRYAFQVSSTLFNDYPHFGVWPDAYYMTTNNF